MGREKTDTMTVKAAAQALSCCPAAIRHAVRHGKLRAKYSLLTPGRIHGIVRADVERLLEAAKKAKGSK